MSTKIKSSRGSNSSLTLDAEKIVEVKSKFDAEFRRFSVDRAAPVTFDEFHKSIEQFHFLKNNPFQIGYVDSDGEVLPINNNENLKKALSTAKPPHRPLLRLIVQRKGEIYSGLNGSSVKLRKKGAVSKLIRESGGTISAQANRHGLAISMPQDFHRVSAIIDVDVVPETCRRVRLMKNGLYGHSKPLGFFIRDGVSRQHFTASGTEKVPAIFVSRLLPGGLAESTGLLAVGDEILEVNGIEVAGKTLDQVSDMMMANSSNLIVTVKPANQKLTLGYNKKPMRVGGSIGDRAPGGGSSGGPVGLDRMLPARFSQLSVASTTQSKDSEPDEIVDYTEEPGGPVSPDHGGGEIGSDEEEDEVREYTTSTSSPGKERSSNDKSPPPTPTPNDQDDIDMTATTTTTSSTTSMAISMNHQHPSADTEDHQSHTNSMPPPPAYTPGPHIHRQMSPAHQQHFPATAHQPSNSIHSASSSSRTTSGSNSGAAVSPGVPFITNTDRPLYPQDDITHNDRPLHPHDVSPQSRAAINQYSPGSLPAATSAGTTLPPPPLNDRDRANTSPSTTAAYSTSPTTSPMLPLDNADQQRLRGDSLPAATIAEPFHPHSQSYHHQLPTSKFTSDEINIQPLQAQPHPGWSSGERPAFQQQPPSRALAPDYSSRVIFSNNNSFHGMKMKTRDLIGGSNSQSESDQNNVDPFIQSRFSSHKNIVYRSANYKSSAAKSSSYAASNAAFRQQQKLFASQPPTQYRQEHEAQERNPSSGADRDGEPHPQQQQQPPEMNL